LLEFSAMADPASLDQAMALQLRRFRDALGRGMPRLGWKIGINDPRMLARLGLEAPVVGWLDGARALRSGEVYMVPPGTRVAIEAEVAVRVGGGGAVAAVAPAFELVNYSVPANSLEGVLEHDIFHDAVVLGRETLPVPVADGEWPTIVRNGTEVARRDPSLLVLQPASTIRHVAAVLARHGETLEADDWLILGSLIQPIPVHAGDRLTADFGPLGRVSVEIWK
jgi:2-oxo-hept-3-ene-1,7-dioate hydratase